MALKDLLVFLDATHDSMMRLLMSVDLASRHGSRLTALYVREWSQTQLYERRAAEMGLVPSAELDRMVRRVERSLDEEADVQRTALEAAGRDNNLATEWRVVEGQASVVVPQHARYADLCIVGHHRSADEDPNSYSFSERLLFSSGRPSLFIPPGRSSGPLGRHIAVAWNSSRAAARSVNDALPLIERAEQVTVLTVNPEDFIVRNGGLPAENLVEHLRRHGAAAELVQIDHIRTGAIANELQASALAMGADVLVAGAFGHPRLWERMLGGATQDLLDRMTLPVFMSH